jgi:hypothetical protein
VAEKINSEPASPFSDDALRRIAKEKVILALGVKVHVLSYVGVNIFLILLDYFLAIHGTLSWSLIVASSWLVGLGVHSGGYLMYARGVIGENKKGLIFHVIAEVFAAQAIIVINYITSPTILWLVWPIGSMIGAVIVHVIVYNLFFKDKGVPGVKKTWMDRKIEAELKKANRQV